MNVSKVTRFEVIDDHGRSYVAYDVTVDLQLQDDGRTLKAFVNRTVFAPDRGARWARSESNEQV